MINIAVFKVMMKLFECGNLTIHHNLNFQQKLTLKRKINAQNGQKIKKFLDFLPISWYHFGHGVIEVLHSSLDEKNEITLQEFKQKREEYFNEYKEYVQ